MLFCFEYWFKNQNSKQNNIVILCEKPGFYMVLLMKLRHDIFQIWEHSVLRSHKKLLILWTRQQKSDIQLHRLLQKKSNGSSQVCYVLICQRNDYIIGIVALNTIASTIYPNKFKKPAWLIVHTSVAYRGFLAPGARSGLSAPFSWFFSQKKSKMVDPQLISVIFKSKKATKKKNPTFSQSLKGLHGFTRPHEPTSS